MANPDVGVRAGDDVLGHCELSVPPFVVDVSSTGLGVAAVDVWPYNRGLIEGEKRNALILISMKGEILFRKNLAELFGAEAEQFERDMNRIDWYSLRGSTKPDARSSLPLRLRSWGTSGGIRCCEP